MTDIRYKLRYLPLFYEDLEQKLIYITEVLQNQQAANELIDDECGGKIMEVRRFLYSKQDRNKFL